MMFIATLPDMMVPIIAPVWINAPRPENICWKNQAMPMMKAKPTAASATSFLASGDFTSRS